jgi:hypothetical protein
MRCSDRNGAPYLSSRSSITRSTSVRVTIPTSVSSATTGTLPIFWPVMILSASMSGADGGRVVGF